MSAATCPAPTTEHAGTARAGAVASQRWSAVIGQLDEAGSADTRTVVRAPRQRTALLAIGVLAFAVALVGDGQRAAALGALVAVGPSALWLEGRLDVARRRFRWLLAALAEGDRVLGVDAVDALIEAADGDLLTATSTISLEVRRAAEQRNDALAARAG